MSGKLKSCPFCGGKPRFVTLRKQGAKAIECRGCGAGSPLCFPEKGADARDHLALLWNRRYVPKDLQS